jgi:hypothetical protein
LLVDILRGPDFEQVRPARWRDLVSSDHQIETNYMYGEGTVRVYHGDSCEPFETIKLRGLVGELTYVWVAIGRTYNVVSA